MGHWRFTPGNTVAPIAVIARRLPFDPTKKNRNRLATQRFVRSAVGKRLNETDIPSHERSGLVEGAIPDEAVKARLHESFVAVATIHHSFSKKRWHDHIVRQGHEEVVSIAGYPAPARRAYFRGGPRDACRRCDREWMMKRSRGQHPGRRDPRSSLRNRHIDRTGEDTRSRDCSAIYLLGDSWLVKWGAPTPRGIGGFDIPGRSQ